MTPNKKVPATMLRKSNIEKLKDIDASIDLLKIKLSESNKQRKTLLEEVLKGMKIPQNGNSFTIPASKPILKGIRRDLVEIDQAKALTLILKTRNLNGMKLSSTKINSETLPAKVFSLKFSAITWETFR